MPRPAMAYNYYLVYPVLGDLPPACVVGGTKDGRGISKIAGYPVIRFYA